MALWHGIAPGFFLCFIGEFATIVMEQQVSETKYYKPIKKGPFCSIHTEAAKWCYNQFTRRSSERLENASPDEQCSPKSHEVFFFFNSRSFAIHDVTSLRLACTLKTNFTASYSYTLLLRVHKGM